MKRVIFAPGESQHGTNSTFESEMHTQLPHHRPRSAASRRMGRAPDFHLRGSACAWGVFTPAGPDRTSQLIRVPFLSERRLAFRDTNRPGRNKPLKVWDRYTGRAFFASGTLRLQVPTRLLCPDKSALLGPRQWFRAPATGLQYVSTVNVVLSTHHVSLSSLTCLQNTTWTRVNNNSPWPATLRFGTFSLRTV